MHSIPNERLYLTCATFDYFILFNGTKLGMRYPWHLFNRHKERDIVSVWADQIRQFSNDNDISEHVIVDVIEYLISTETGNHILEEAQINSIEKLLRDNIFKTVYATI